jgi:hypothetical protein
LGISAAIHLDRIMQAVTRRHQTCGHSHLSLTRFMWRLRGFRFAAVVFDNPSRVLLTH